MEPNKTFEEFLRDIHFALYPQLLDDDLDDHFQEWSKETDLIEWGELYGKKRFLEGKESALRNQ